MLINCVAYENGSKLADIPVEDDQRLPAAPGLLRLGGAEGRRRPRSSTRCSRSSACTSSRWRMRATATSARRSRSTATWCSPCVHTLELTPTDELSRARSTSSSGRNYVLSVRNRSQHSFLGVRERAEQEPHLLQHGAGIRVLRADGCRRRPLLPDHRLARDRPRSGRGADLRARHRAREHRGALRPQAQASASCATR